MGRQQEHGEGHEPLAPHGEIFSSGHDASPVADGQADTDDHVIGVQHEPGHEASTGVAAPESAPPEQCEGAVVEISVEEYQELLAAQQKLEQRTQQGRERSRRYRQSHPEKAKEWKRQWAKTPRGRQASAERQRRYRERVKQSKQSP